MKAKITVTMSSQLKRNLNTAYTIGAPLKEYLKNATELIRNDAKKEAPVDLGKMRDSHKALIDNSAIPKWGRMEVQAVGRRNAPYPLFVHEGTKPHFPPVSAIEGWANRHGINPFALALSISRKGTKPNPWLERTVDKDMPKLKDMGNLAGIIQKQWNKP